MLEQTLGGARSSEFLTSFCLLDRFCLVEHETSHTHPGIPQTSQDSLGSNSRPGPCGHTWAIVSPLGPCGPTLLLWAPWALEGRALVRPPGPLLAP